MLWAYQTNTLLNRPFVPRFLGETLFLTQDAEKKAAEEEAKKLRTAAKKEGKDAKQEAPKEDSEKKGDDEQEDEDDDADARPLQSLDQIGAGGYLDL